MRKKIGEGGFAKVYVADCSEDELTSMIMSSMIDNTCSVALKVRLGLTHMKWGWGGGGRLC